MRQTQAEIGYPYRDLTNRLLAAHEDLYRMSFSEPLGSLGYFKTKRALNHLMDSIEALMELEKFKEHEDDKV